MLTVKSSDQDTETPLGLPPGSRVTHLRGKPWSGVTLCFPYEVNSNGKAPLKSSRFFRLNEEVLLGREILYESGSIRKAGERGTVVENEEPGAGQRVMLVKEPNVGAIGTITSVIEPLEGGEKTITVTLPGGESVKDLTPSDYASESVFVKFCDVPGLWLMRAADLTPVDSGRAIDIFNPETEELLEDVPLHEVQATPTEVKLGRLREKVKNSVSISEMVLKAFQMYQDLPFLGGDAPGGGLRWISYATAKKRVEAIGHRLLELCKEQGEREDGIRRPFVMLCGNNRPEYVWCFLACLLHKIIAVPIAPTLSLDHVKHIMSEVVPAVAIVDPPLVETWRGVAPPSTTVVGMHGQGTPDGVETVTAWEADGEVPGMERVVSESFADEDHPTQTAEVTLNPVSPIAGFFGAYALEGELTHSDLGNNVPFVMRLAGSRRKNHAVGIFGVTPGDETVVSEFQVDIDGNSFVLTTTLPTGLHLRLAGKEGPSFFFAGTIEGGETFSMSAYQKKVFKSTDSRDCLVCGSRLEKHPVGTIVPLRCVECFGYLRKGSTKAMGCIPCGVVVCGPCFKKARRTQCIDEGIGLDEPSMILYTSGSTGLPKGAIMSEGSFLRELRSSLVQNNTDRVAIMTTPMAVSSMPTRIMGSVIDGGRLGLFDPSFVLQRIEAVGPTALGLVPQMWEVFRSQYADGKAPSTALGRRIRVLNAGGAKPNPAVMAWLKECFPQCFVTENYATTETGGITSTLHDGEVVFDAGIEIKLVDWGEYTSEDKPYPRGEICVKTKTMATGYLNRPDLTSEAFDEEGFFRTGDIGERVDRGHRHFYRVIDRKKALFKLANGEWVSPAHVESILVTSPLISQVFVFGDSSDPCVVAITVPASGLTPEECTPAKMREACCAVGEANGLRHFMIPAAVHVSHEPFVVGNGLTPTNKLSRPQLMERFRGELEELRRKAREAVEEGGSRVVDDVLELLKCHAKHKAGEAEEARWQALPLHESIRAMQAVFAVKRHFGVTISPGLLLDRSHTLSDVARAVFEAGGMSSEVVLEAMQSDLQRVLPDEVRPVPDGATRTAVLVTGATGFVGAAVVGRLAEAPGVDTVFAVVRGGTQKECESRIAVSLMGRGYGKALDKVVVVRGDLTLPGLGLSDEDRNEVDAKCGTIIHCGAVVNHLATYKTLASANVNSVGEVMKLAATGAKRVVYVSTISAVSNGKDENSEMDNLEDVAGWGSGYGQSKHVAERVCAEAWARGFDVRVVRLGMVGYDAQTGSANLEDWIMRFVVGGVLLACFPVQDEQTLHVTEVGYAAQAIVALCSSPLPRDNAAPRFHIPVAPLSTTHLLSGVAAAMGPERVQEVSLRHWQALLDSIPTINPIFPLKAQLSQGLSGCSPHPFTSTVATLAKLGLASGPPHYTLESHERLTSWLCRNHELLANEALLDQCFTRSSSFT